MNHTEPTTPRTSDPLSEYVHHKKVPPLYPNLLTQSSMQWMIRNRADNGLEPHVMKWGNKIFIHLPSFSEWLDSHRGKAGAPIRATDYNEN
ncbi:MAG: hypothetical protein V7742_21175 [Halioglobus sp.]